MLPDLFSPNDPDNYGNSDLVAMLPLAVAFGLFCYFLTFLGT